jgi:mRNA-degrading endonuclease RelE of RelBE toxin-antitoxin system
MDKFEKAFKNLSAKEQKQLEEILARLEAGLFTNLDIKKLKAGSDIYRIRKGNIRAIYQIRNNQIFLLKISRRSEKTYRDF